MATWPLSSHYAKMLQNPKIAFRDPTLQGCQIDYKNNVPHGLSGQFAIVYKGTHSGGEVAIRVFTRKSEERRERYKIIRDHIRSLNVQSLVDFEYHEKGIRVADMGGKWFPLLTMEWVPGDTLFDWVEAQCQNGNRAALGGASERWVELVEELTANKIVHGDLQALNVMVTPKAELKLVDYDGMCVPDLVGRKNLECGVVPYQHPARDDDTELFMGLDNFSAFYILVALRAFAADPQLWSTYNVLPDGNPYDKLLFREEDFQKPKNSALLKELKGSSDEKVRKWSKDLVELTEVPIRDVPELSALMTDVEKVRELLSAQAWDEAIELLDRGKTEVPSDMQADVGEARQRVECREKLELAIESGNEREMERLFGSQLLTNYPKAQPLVSIAQQAPQAIAALNELNGAQQSNDVRGFVTLWDQHASLLSSRKSAEQLASQVDAWRRRNQYADEILEAVNGSDCDGGRLKTTWSELGKLGGHPDADGLQSKISDLIRRHDAFNDFSKIPHEKTKQNDQLLDAAWNEQLFNGWPRAESERPRVQTAKARLQQLDELEAIVQRHGSDVSVETEQEIWRAADPLPDRYEASLHDRAQLARKRLNAYNSLQDTQHRTPDDEIALANAWKTLEAAQAQSMVDLDVRDRLELAAKRSPVLKELQKIDLKMSADQRDKLLLESWKKDILDGCTQADAWRTAWQEARERKVLLGQLDAAITAEDDAAIAKIRRSKLLKNYPFPAHITARMTKASEAIEGMLMLLETLKSDRRSEFLQTFNGNVIRDHCKEFEPFRTQIAEWIDSDVRPPEATGLKPPIARAGVTPNGRTRDGHPREFHVRWSWPEKRFTEKCRLELTRKKPAEDAVPDDVPHIDSYSINRKEYESGGGRKTIADKRERRGSYVVVWAWIDLGFESFFSKPLVLGRLK